MKTFTILGVPYEFPESGAEPDWAEKVVAWAEAVTSALEVVVSTGDLITSVFSFSSGVSTPTNITGFNFDGSLVNGFIGEVTIVRTDGVSETITLAGAYNSDSDTWTVAQSGNNLGSTEVELTITSAGQIQYTSGSVEGTITYRARALKSTA